MICENWCENVCVCGDFNVVRCPEERRSVGSAMNYTSSASFNDMIEDNCLGDLPLRGAGTLGTKGMGGR